MHSAQSGQFTLPSGWTVVLTALKMRPTYGGALEGSPEALTRFYRKRLAESAQTSLLAGLPLIILGAEVSVLPTFQWEAQFFSYRGVKTSDSDYSSYLALCWFSDDIPRDLPAAIEEILLPLDWETLAEDYDNLP